LKSIEDNFKYQVSLFELYYREQWLEKKFVFNCVDLTFDICDFYFNIKLFFFIVSRGALPIYLFGEILDNLTRLGSSLVALYKWRQFIYKLKSLQDVTGGVAKDGEEAKDLQCCICLGNIVKGKQLECTHVFHLVCLRSWLLEKVECPTCRAPIVLDKPKAAAVEAG
jgi:E3 ubiquitin-protein ligase synoviolin